MAIVHGVTWGFLQPPFQGPDEPAHFAYAQFIADSGRLRPDPDARSGQGYSNHVQTLLSYLPFSIEGPTNWAPGEARRFKEIVTSTPYQAGDGSAAALGTPPLYFIVQAPVAALTRGWEPQASLLAARWLAALLNGITVVLILLFLRELFPRQPWAWPLGALAVAVQPVFGFMGGSVNPDGLLFTISAALFLLAARTMRRGLTLRRAIAIAALAVAGSLTKGTTYALLPGLATAGLIGTHRAYRGGTTLARLAGAAGAGVALFIVGFGGYLYANAHLLSSSPASAGAFVTSEAAARTTTLVGQLEYTWQFFFPRLWNMQDQFPGYPSYPLWDFYIKGFVGRFGFWQYDFPLWVEWAGLATLVALLSLAAVALVPRLASRGIRLELAVYAFITVTVLVAVSVAGYRYTSANKLDFEQTRYIFPLLPLYGALIPTAALAFGRRRAPQVGALLLVLLAVHGLGGELLVLARYYA